MPSDGLTPTGPGSSCSFLSRKEDTSWASSSLSGISETTLLSQVLGDVLPLLQVCPSPLLQDPAPLVRGPVLFDLAFDLP